MRWTPPLLLLGVLALGVLGSPVSSPESGPVSNPTQAPQHGQARQATQAPAADDDDDDSDDDDDDVDLDLEDDDDDDDDDDTADDDDDDDDEDYFERFFDDILGDSDDDDEEEDDTPSVAAPLPVVAAGPAAAPVQAAATPVEQPAAVRPGTMSASKPSSAPPIYISKYNRFVDNVLARINRVLKKNYDPVNVRLHPSTDSNNNNKKKNNNKKGTKKKASAGGNKPREGESQMLHTNGSAVAQDNGTDALAATVAAVSEQLAGAQRPSQRLVQVPTVQRRSRKTNNKVKKNSSRSRPGARATLYGLSSLKRDGDVTVNMMSSHNTVKTKFTVGPLMLKVEKEFGRGAKKDIRSATATTTEMSGRLNLRVMHGGAATLHSIRVMQPRQVRVESLDDHDKTREYIWRRSSNIARVVSQKLTNATRSMLQPPPVTTNFMSTIFS